MNSPPYWRSISHPLSILIIGGADYIGRFAAQHLRARGHTVTIYDNLSGGKHPAALEAKVVVGDLKNTRRFNRLLADREFDAVLHLASTAESNFLENPSAFYKNSILNGVALLDALCRNDVLRVVFSSSAAVYDGTTFGPRTELDAVGPIGPWGRAKLTFEGMLADYAAAYGLCAASLRIFNVAGAALDGSPCAAPHPEDVISSCLRVARGETTHVDVWGTDYETPDGTLISDYVHVEDVAEAFALTLEKQREEGVAIYNVGSGRASSVREVIRTCESVSGKSIATLDRPKHPYNSQSQVASYAKLRAALGWRPKFSDLRTIVETAWHAPRN